MDIIVGIILFVYVVLNALILIVFTLDNAKAYKQYQDNINKIYGVE